MYLARGESLTHRGPRMSVRDATRDDEDMLGSVTALCRYPVKSMLGEDLDASNCPATVRAASRTSAR